MVIILVGVLYVVIWLLKFGKSEACLGMSFFSIVLAYFGMNKEFILALYLL